MFWKIEKKTTVNTWRPLYKTIHYNMILNTTWSQDASQKSIGYIELNDH